MGVVVFPPFFIVIQQNRICLRIKTIEDFSHDSALQPTDNNRCRKLRCQSRVILSRIQDIHLRDKSLPAAPHLPIFLYMLFVGTLRNDNADVFIFSLTQLGSQSIMFGKGASFGKDLFQATNDGDVIIVGFRCKVILFTGKNTATLVQISFGRIS